MINGVFLVYRSPCAEMAKSKNHTTHNQCKWKQWILTAEVYILGYAGDLESSGDLVHIRVLHFLIDWKGQGGCYEESAVCINWFFFWLFLEQLVKPTEMASRGPRLNATSHWRGYVKMTLFYGSFSLDLLLQKMCCRHCQNPIFYRNFNRLFHCTAKNICNNKSSERIKFEGNSLPVVESSSVHIHWRLYTKPGFFCVFWHFNGWMDLKEWWDIFTRSLGMFTWETFHFTATTRTHTMGCLIKAK